MTTDPLSNALSKMLNAEKAGKSECMFSPCSKIIKAVIEIMKKKDYISSFEFKEHRGGIAKVDLNGNINMCKVIKPRFAVKKENFEKYEKRYLPASGFGLIIISTSKGIMTFDEAREKNLGGKLIAFIY